uniref:Uncharacterized protein n=1 Tax=mine drainage metagenome TaxID=410659 RepID=E6PMM9_9ZZZZ
MQEVASSRRLLRAAVEFREQRQHGLGQGHGDAGAPGQFHRGAEQGLHFQRPAALQVLQGGGLDRTDAAADGNALLGIHLRVAAIGAGERDQLLHDATHQVEQARVGADLVHARAGERGHRVERGVADELHPDGVANARGGFGVASGFAQRGGERFHARTQTRRPLRWMGRLADDVTVLAVGLDDTRRRDLGRAMHHAADDVREVERAGHAAVRVEAGDARSAAVGRQRLRAGVAVEIPPGQTVDRRQHHGALLQHAAKAWQQRGHLVGLHAQHDQVLRAEIFGSVAGLQLRRLVASGVLQTQTPGAYGLQMRAARDHTHRMPGPRQLHRKAAAHRSRSHHHNPHRHAPVTRFRLFVHPFVPGPNPSPVGSAVLPDGRSCRPGLPTPCHGCTTP